MGDRRICISKQVTFISLIFLLLLSYVFFAYWTSLNKTSTNSRAETPKKKSIINIPQLTEQKRKSLQFSNAVMDKNGNVQIPERNNSKKRFEIWYMDDYGKYTYFGESSNTSRSKNNFIPQHSNIKLPPEYIKSGRFYFVEIQ